MNDCLLIQCVTEAKYARMIGLYYDRHADYCANHAIDYWVHTGPVRWSPNWHWDKFALATQAFILGYEYVIYLDNDAYICDPAADVRDACIKAMNMTRWNYPLSHLQSGVIYMNNGNGMARAICSHMLEEAPYYVEMFPTLRGWFEQGMIGMLLDTSLGKYFGEVDIAWNWCKQFCQPCPHPFVMAWHGVSDATREEEMREELGR